MCIRDSLPPSLPPSLPSSGSLPPSLRVPFPLCPSSTGSYHDHAAMEMLHRVCTGVQKRSRSLTRKWDHGSAESKVTVARLQWAGAGLTEAGCVSWGQGARATRSGSVAQLSWTLSCATSMHRTWSASASRSAREKRLRGSRASPRQRPIHVTDGAY
eukprot:3359174-Rhodomonas_salina.1